ncbi:MAG: pyrimidine-nucleoside phosphorylase [Clostridia bacterium]|nr:pyrimidine-nucleoside phosphorylase [Clostridia bacterium]
MRMYDIIYKKRQGHELSKEEIDFAIGGFVSGDVPDYQMSALAMAICFNGMSSRETFYLTDAMMRSGDVVDLSRFDGLCVDKHSTGGVGDKTTLIIAPIVACLGARVAKMSGRGLGFTGGTVDKLESLGSYRSSLSSEEFLSQVEKIGIAVTGQSGNLVPADKKLYALRDVTATVDSIPLIASSIMSKKLASGAHAIVLDVKCGSGAFMKNEADATLLAEAMIDIGKQFGRRVCALITDMSVPLGHFVGNSLEVYEAIQVLSGKGEARLTELCVALASNMISMVLGLSIDEATERVLDAISSGKALDKMREWICAQGGDVSLIDSPTALLGAKFKHEFRASKSGYISKIDAEGVGIASMLLGAGRAKKDDEIDHFAGIELRANLGDSVCENDVIAILYASSEELFDGAVSKLDEVIEISPAVPQKSELIKKIVF